mmetsp:Transcript_7368/g.22037  ORF Transcript_7368/g.22037 Transcript_7368/m.22037 type:complete len:207 (+) Transcript_7368:145-765(+)
MLELLDLLARGLRLLRGVARGAVHHLLDLVRQPFEKALLFSAVGCRQMALLDLANSRSFLASSGRFENLVAASEYPRSLRAALSCLRPMPSISCRDSRFAFAFRTRSNCAVECALASPISSSSSPSPPPLPPPADSFCCRSSIAAPSCSPSSPLAPCPRQTARRTDPALPPARPRAAARTLQWRRSRAASPKRRRRLCLELLQLPS